MSETEVVVPSIEDKEKIGEIAEYVSRIIEVLGLDTADPNLAGTPERVAKMYLEMFRGLSEGAEPTVTFFPNEEHYQAMVMEKDIPFYSLCSHHFVPFYGRATVDFTADQPGVTLFHCHIQAHMDFGFKALFRYA